MTFRVAHFSDTHLGYESYPALAANGNNQRGQDVVRAFMNTVADVKAWDPDLVIHSGDVLDRPRTDIRFMYLAQRQFRELTVRPDGSLRPVIVLAGNHEQSRNRKEVCWVELLSHIDGVFPVSNAYTRLTFPAGKFAPELDNLVVHAIPHDSLKSLVASEVTPTPGSVNILTAHGVASGSELFFRALGREYPIPTEVLDRDWDYVALGHWHKQGPVTLGPGGPRLNIWYAGSTENFGFRDIRDNGEKRGYLRVTVQPGELPDVTPVNLPIRSMFRLPAVDAAGKTAAEIVDEMKSRVAAADIAGAVVGQVVINVPRDLWSLVDVAAVRETASKAMHFEVTARYVGAVENKDDSAVGVTDFDQLESALAKKLETIPEVFRVPVGEKVRTHITAQRGKFEEQS